MLSCHKNIKLFTLSILSCAVLLGCNTEKDSYKGPVQGNAKIVKGTDTATSSDNIKLVKLKPLKSPLKRAQLHLVKTSALFLKHQTSPRHLYINTHLQLIMSLVI